MTDRPDSFEGEPEYVQYFWDKAQKGGAEVDDTVYKFTITREDSKKYPELKPGMRLLLAKSTDGFIFHDILPPRVTS
jgi:hypothetical protein